MTNAEKIHALQTSLLMEISKHASSPTDRFVALAAFCANNPVDALLEMQENKHDSLPAPGKAWIAQSAVRVAEAIYA